MKKAIYDVLTPEELYALDRRARRERARFVGTMMVSGALALKSVYERALAALTAKVVRHA